MPYKTVNYQSLMSNTKYQKLNQSAKPDALNYVASEILTVS